jgi:SAM-dependent methyltransferase
LEVGCGAGQLAALLMTHGVTEYTGFDLSPTAIDLARGNVPNGRVLVANAFETELFTTATYDALLCTEVLEHLDRDLELIALWPVGTRCLCTVPDFMAKSHVRIFPTANSVTDRYGALFAALDVMPIARPSPKGGQFFLMDGMRG